MDTLCGSDASEFYEYMLFNNPVLIKCSAATWPLRKLFFTEDGSFSPSLLSAAYGDEVILVHSATGENSQEMCISEFISRIAQGEGLYAKDWHFFQFPDTTHMYTVPSVFTDDWLNMYWHRIRKQSDDYRFLYIGGEHSATNVHHDVLFSYSWSLNVHGRKRWTLWRPEETPLLRTTCSSSSGAEEYVKDAREGHYDAKVFPDVSRANPLTVVQEEGEAIFVPAGWYHMVHNIGVDQGEEKEHNVTVSVNHNWINVFNIYKAWKFLVVELNNTRQEMWDFLDASHRQHYMNTSANSRGSDGGRHNLWKSREGVGMGLQEWLTHCELTLRINAGLGCKEFLEMIVSRVVCLAQIHFKTLSCQKSETQLISCARYAPFISGDASIEPQDIDSEVYGRLSLHFVSSAPPHSRPHEQPWGRDSDVTEQSDKCKCSSKCMDITDILLEELMEKIDLTFPMSSFEYCMLEVLRIILEIKSSLHVKEHIGAVYAAGAGAAGVEAIPMEAPADRSDACLDNVEVLLMACLFAKKKKDYVDIDTVTHS